MEKDFEILSHHSEVRRIPMVRFYTPKLSGGIGTIEPVITRPCVHDIKVAADTTPYRDTNKLNFYHSLVVVVVLDDGTTIEVASQDQKDDLTYYLNPRFVAPEEVATLGLNEAGRVAGVLAEVPSIQWLLPAGAPLAWGSLVLISDRTPSVRVYNKD